MKFRVVSYNVLSSHLATPSSYPTFKPEHLDSCNRLRSVLKKLEAETSPPLSSGESLTIPTIIALQEVSYEWAGSLHTFFSNRGYHFITGLYGKSFNGYMGVGLAWPSSSFSCIETNISRLSDHRIGGWPKKESTDEGTLNWLIKTPLKLLGLVKDPPECNWKLSQRRFNVIIGATLQHKLSGEIICVANYHMPCAFYAPQAMTIHADMAIRHVQEMAKRASTPLHLNQNNKESIVEASTDISVPYVLAGDFNLKPVDGVYKYLTSGTLDSKDPFYPLPPSHDPSFEWSPGILEPVKSAYADFQEGKEPDFTNYAFSDFHGAFIDTLDYIFVSPKVKVTGVRPLPHREEVKGPFPNIDPDVDEPSDHIMIGATLAVGTSNK